MHVSFEPDGSFFVFDADGATVKRGFKSRHSAWAWVLSNHGYQ